MVQRRKTNNNVIVFLYVLSAIYIVFRPFLIQFGFFDEIMVLLLALYSLKDITFYKQKFVYYTGIILLLYLFYSLWINVTVRDAVFFDFLLFLKPFVSFFLAYYLSTNLNIKTKKILKLFFLILGIYCYFILPYINDLYSNTAAYYPACIICSVSYLFFSERTKKDWIISLIILIPGLFSVRAKFYTEFLFFAFIAFFVKKRIHVNIKYLIVFSILISFAIYINWDKFSMYFLFDEETKVGRSLFYIHSIDILRDFFPFGSGFGTFGTEAAAKYYSPLYSIYHMNNVWGLREIDYGGTGHDFLKDTFYPVLAQFGVVGVFLFILFWRKIIIMTKYLNIEKYKLAVFVIMIMFIQNIADNSFVGPLGVPCMMMIGFLLSNPKNTICSVHNP